MNRHQVDVVSYRQRRRRQRALATIGSLPVIFSAVAAGAQQPRDTVVTRTVSSWQSDVDRLKSELLSQQRLRATFNRMLIELEMRKHALPDSQAKYVAQAQLLHSKLRQADAEQLKLRRQLETMCETVRRPEGWLGVVTSGFQMQDKRTDGTKIIRFLEPPVVASVDPGSPAERAGVRAGDVLLEIGGQRVLQQNIVFADMLRPGKEIVIKLQRHGEVVTFTPTVEPLPDVGSTTSCAFVDPAVAYVVAPVPSQAPAMRRAVRAGGGGYTYVTTRSPGDSSGAVFGVLPASASGNAVTAGPMVQMYTSGVNPVAGTQLVALTPESSRNLGIPHGILVNQVLPGPGREAGLQGGDILIAADGVELTSVQQLRNVISRSTDRVVTLLIVRDRKRETVKLRW